MSLLRGLGRIAALPIRVVNAPLRAIEHGVSFAVDGRPARDDERTLSIAGEAAARAIEETAAEITGDEK